MTTNTELKLPNIYMKHDLYSKEDYNTNSKYGVKINTEQMLFPSSGTNYYIYQQLENEAAKLYRTIKNLDKPMFIDLFISDEKIPIINKSDKVGYYIAIPSNIDPN